MNALEDKLWNYIDGNCSADEQAAIEALIDSDEAYRSKYLELLAFNKEMDMMELEEPSMAFTYNIMEAVRADEAKVPLKSAINKNLIRGLAAVFIIIIVLLVGYALVSVNWNASSNGVAGNFKIPAFKIPALSTGADNFLIKGAMFFITVLGLLFADAWLRNQRISRRV